MKKFIFGFIVGVLVLPIAAYLFLLSGKMPVATKGPPLPLEKFVVRTAMRAALKNENSKSPPIDASEETFVSGAKIYRSNCMACHGLPGEPQGSIARGMFPNPPQLFEKSAMVTDDPVGKIFWKSKNGIRLTGMPGFSDSLTETEIWQVTLLLANADRLPEKSRRALLEKEARVP